MNIIVTGASQGIGFEIVKILAENKNNKIIAIARNKEKLKLLKGQKNNIITIPYDLLDIRIDLIDQIKNSFSNLDILINNAGLLINKPFEELKKSDIKKIYKINLFSIIELTQYLLPLLKLSKKSHVVNISSMGGYQGSMKFYGLSAYSSSKAALSSITECLAEEYKETNISFNCLAIGAVQTEMLNKAFPNYKAKINAKEMAEYIVDFSLKANKILNGKIIPVSLSNP